MTVSAHARWFADQHGTYPADWDFLAEPLTLGLVASATVMAAVWVLATRRRPVAPLPLGRLAAWVPRLLAATLGISLAALAADGKLLSPGVALGGSPPHVALAAFELLVGGWLIVGVRLRGAAVALAGLIIAAALLVGPVRVLESGVVAGIALYLALAPGDDANAHRNRVRWLRLALGGSLVLVAFTEKLTGPALTQAVLHEHPSLNVLAAAGLPVADLRFVGLAGAAEVFLGIVIASGAGSQLIALAALVPFTATVGVFGAPELVGHLPIYGALCALAITGSDRDGADAKWPGDETPARSTPSCRSSGGEDPAAYATRQTAPAGHEGGRGLQRQGMPTRAGDDRRAGEHGPLSGASGGRCRAARR